MFDELFGKPSDVVIHTIAPYAAERQGFLEHCRAQGFSKTCLKQVAGILLTAATDLQAHGGLDGDLERLEAAAARLAAIRKAAGFTQHAHGYRRTFLRFTSRWLRFVGRFQAPAARLRPYASLLEDFGGWMSDERGLSSATLQNRSWHVGQFLDWLHGRRQRVTDLDLADLDGYVHHLQAKGLSRVTIKIHTNAVRAFVRHAERRGWCAAGLADGLQGPHIYRQHGLPLGPSWDEVTKLIQDATTDAPADLRDRPILLLMAVYGLRANEVSNLRLEDIDWEHERLSVRRSKQRRSQVYPLVPIVGEAIVRYLQMARPQCPLREVFLKLHAPIGPMTSRSLYVVVAHRIKRLGIQAPRRGPHVLRHACAGHLLAQGLSLKEIGDHLGHRSAESTRIYAKVDLQGLREVAAFDLGEIA